MTLRARVVVASALSLLGAIGIGLIARSWLALSGPYPWKAAVVQAAAVVLVNEYVGGNHPFCRFGPANAVTMVRAMFVALLAALIGEQVLPEVAAAAVLTTVAVATLDGVDGWLARRTPMASVFGARFDMETDAAFIMVLSVLVWQFGKAGPWVLVGGVLRYAFGAAGWVLPWLGRPLSPTLRGKTVAVLHMVGLGVAMAPIVPVPLSRIVAALTLAALVASFAIDVGRLWSGSRIDG